VTTEILKTNTPAKMKNSTSPVEILHLITLSDKGTTSILIISDASGSMLISILLLNSAD
jgi:hypothetical protein